MCGFFNKVKLQHVLNWAKKRFSQNITKTLVWSVCSPNMKPMRNMRKTDSWYMLVSLTLFFKLTSAEYFFLCLKYVQVSVSIKKQFHNEKFFKKVLLLLLMFIFIYSLVKFNRKFQFSILIINFTS